MLMEDRMAIAIEGFLEDFDNDEFSSDEILNFYERRFRIMLKEYKENRND